MYFVSKQQQKEGKRRRKKKLRIKLNKNTKIYVIINFVMRSLDGEREKQANASKETLQVYATNFE